MNKIKMFIAKRFFKELLPHSASDATAKKSGGIRELASQFAKAVVFKLSDDTDFEDPDFEMTDIEAAYDTDSYVRQGVDKYVDQLFKEGYTFYGKDSNIVAYINQRLAYIAEATGVPTNQFLIDIAEDLVKYGNAMIVKARSNDPNCMPEGVNIAGLAGADPVAGYYCANPATMTCARDKYGTITKWQQETDAGTQEFKPTEVVHFYYKRKRGNAYGTSLLVPVLDDVRSLRQAEENVLKMMYRSIYPFHHVIVGTDENPGTEAEVEQMADVIDNMEVDGGVVTTEKVQIKPIASDKVINAEPYLRYMEQRVFSGFAIPDVLWGRGESATKSSSDNMAAEMADRIRAIHRIIELFFNEFIIKELLMEGGYDPVLNPDQAVSLKFNDNDIDVMIKKEVHAIYKYEHNAITEDEMRLLIGTDPLEESARERMYQKVVTEPNLHLQYGDKMAESEASVAAAKAMQSGGSGSGTKNNDGGSKETNNKQKNGGGNGQGNKKAKSGSTKSSPNKSAGKSAASCDPLLEGLIKDSINSMEDAMIQYIDRRYSDRMEILNLDIEAMTAKCARDICYIINAKMEMPPEMKDYIIKQSVRFVTNAGLDMAGMNTRYTSKGTVLDIVGIRIYIFRQDMLEALTKFQDAV